DWTFTTYQCFLPDALGGSPLVATAGGEASADGVSATGAVSGAGGSAGVVSGATGSAAAESVVMAITLAEQVRWGLGGLAYHGVSFVSCLDFSAALGTMPPSVSRVNTQPQSASTNSKNTVNSATVTSTTMVSCTSRLREDQETLFISASV